MVSIWVCPSPPGERRNSITRCHITEENLWGNVKEPVRHYDLIDVVLLCLGGVEDSDGIFKLLSTLLSSKAAVVCSLCRAGRSRLSARPAMDACHPWAGQRPA